jgi:hypothetical protein
MEPTSVQFYVRMRLMAPFATQDETRMQLETMKADPDTVTALNTPRNRIFSAGARIPLVDPDLSHSVQVTPGYIRVAVISYNEAGMENKRIGVQNVFSYTWDTFQQEWRIN